MSFQRVWFVCFVERGMGRDHASKLTGRECNRVLLFTVKYNYCNGLRDVTMSHFSKSIGTARDRKKPTVVLSNSSGPCPTPLIQRDRVESPAKYFWHSGYYHRALYHRARKVWTAFVCRNEQFPQETGKWHACLLTRSSGATEQL